jgi:predicted RNase H-like HicB family nuclease
MNIGVLFEKVQDKDFSPGYFYAHIPSLGLTTHGLGIEGARSAALDLIKLWLAEKKANHETLPASSEILFSTLDVPEDALQSA